ncbi:MAG: metallophosphoesterase [Mycoplasma sp.]|nr:metallophosphoesterase [Mycoplasma sp.]
MERIILISDNHGNEKIVNKILSQEEYDLSIHLGDSENNSKWANSLFDYAVRGNNDFNDLKDEIFFEYKGKKFMILHGHTRGIYVHNWQDLPQKVAKQENVDIIIHGHSHIPYFNKEDNIISVCPGSPTLPRSEFGPSYAILNIDGENIDVELKQVI